MGDAADIAEMRACSACSGDYEDPDRTAWLADEAESDAGTTEVGTGTEQPEASHGPAGRKISR